MEDDDVNTEDINNPEEEQFEITPEQATSLDSRKPGILNRKKILVVLCCTMAAILVVAMISNAAKPAKKKTAAQDNEFASSNSSQDFLTSLRDRAVNRREPEAAPVATAEAQEAASKEEKEPVLPPVSFNRSPEVEAIRSYPPPGSAAGAHSAPSGAPASNAPQQNPTHFRSSLVPPIQGSLFSQGASQPGGIRSAQTDPSAAQYAARAPNAGSAYNQPSEYQQQNDQQNKQAFFDAAGSGGSVFNGQFIGANAVWTGTIIPGILETAINTDLPGNILARVTQNIYDSQSGRNLLIPQGTILLARYNSSISFAQHRIQIVWDTMIRPDGFQINLEGANGVDRSGMSGQPAKFSENWFEYLKAAGIITLFSYANAKMTETAAKYSTEASAANLAASNADFVGELGGRLAGRAMNIQPTLTVENGTLINIMLNKTLYLPPVAGYPASQKYLLE
jgi:type IV secretion system protein VirB10